MVNIAVLVLAGGQSRRMGRDKALLQLPLAHQPTLLEYICNLAIAFSPQTYVLSPWPQRYEKFLPKTLTSLQEPSAGNGPLVALAQGWSMILDSSQQRQQNSPDWLLVLACDMPTLEILQIKHWQQTLTHVDESAIAALPRHLDRWEPLCGFYHRRCIPSLETAIQNQVRSFQRWLANESVIQLPLSNSHMLRNCNTPLEWQQFLSSTSARNL
ncbi:MAG: molybdenum cofactor guanylyltransferase [Leptolyngbya sp. SIO3F4]|nr:molybdenum cofactor guanylyltransferase [Leptolyngbya sp. SIO3F4]